MKKIIYFFVISSVLIIYSCNNDVNSIAEELSGTYTGEYFDGLVQYENSKTDITVVNDNTVKIKVYSPANLFESYTFDNILVVFDGSIKDTSSLGGEYIFYKLNFKNINYEIFAGWVKSHSKNKLRQVEIVSPDSLSFGFTGTK